jgi:hypothetical protein
VLLSSSDFTSRRCAPRAGYWPQRPSKNADLRSDIGLFERVKIWRSSKYLVLVGWIECSGAVHSGGGAF